jgi:aryl-alcohol dehydrogenase-like predicted oxidoreductase
MKTIADKKGWDITELAIKFILSHKPISVVLPTMISIDEIDKFSEISDEKISRRPRTGTGFRDVCPTTFYVVPSSK